MTPVLDSDRQEAVLAAKELFWCNGYEDTSVEELVQATGMNRYALYNAYGGKLELFLAVLEDYFLERKSLFLTVISDQSRGPMDAIREVSEYCISEMVERGAGCLMCNVALEVGHYDKIVAERVTAYLDEIHAAKEMALAQAKERGELNPMLTPEQGASMLIVNMLGGGVKARNGAGKKELLDNFNTCMSLLANPENLERTRTRRAKKG